MGSERLQKNLVGEGSKSVSGEPGSKAPPAKRREPGNPAAWLSSGLGLGTGYRVSLAIHLLRAVAMIAAVLATSGCCHRPALETIDRLRLIGASPRPTPAHATRAWQEAEAYIADRPGADIMVGCGDSMLPFYRSRTLLVTEQQPYKDWRPGQTVVFRGETGRPVAHLLVVKNREGWRSAGLARAEFDHVLVTPRNYLGTVTKAYELVPLGAVSHATAAIGSSDWRTAASLPAAVL